MKRFFTIIFIVSNFAGTPGSLFAGGDKKAPKHIARGEHQVILSWQRLTKKIRNEKKRRKKKMKFVLSF